MRPAENDSVQLLLGQVLSSQQAMATDVSASRADLGKIAVHLERIDTRNEGADRLHADHEGRLRVVEKLDTAWVTKLGDRVTSLEAFRWKALGALGLLQVAGGFVIWYVTQRR